jgi:hypothetical protein
VPLRQVAIRVLEDVRAERATSAVALVTWVNATVTPESSSWAAEETRSGKATMKKSVQSTRKAQMSRPFCHAGGGTRTPDTRIMIPLL